MLDYTSILSTYRSALESTARSVGVSPEVHPEDFIFRFVYEHPGFKTKEEAIDYYFHDGAKSAAKLRALLSDVCEFGPAPLDLLEFASGYGCVTRHLTKALPGVSVQACDIHPQALSFIEEKMSVKTVLSEAVPEDARVARQFDAVFALSFFSHMPKTTFSRWMATLASFVKPGGFVLFTTHGLVSKQKCVPDAAFDDEGFYFVPSSEQADLSAATYGTTVTTPEYVIGQVLKNPKLRLKLFHEAAWWGHQDLYVLTVLAEPSAT